MSKFTSDQQKEIDKLTKQYQDRGYRTTGADMAQKKVQREAEEARKAAEREAAKKKK